MLGLVGIHLRKHEDGQAFCTVHPVTNEHINLQPWFVYDVIPGTKGMPPQTRVYRPATQEDFKAIMKVTDPTGTRKNPLIGELPPDVAKQKQEMFDKAMAEANKKAEPEKPKAIPFEKKADK